MLSSQGPAAASHRFRAAREGTPIQRLVRTILVSIGLGCSSLLTGSGGDGAGAGETLRDTELKELPDFASPTLSELTEGTELALGQRQGAWYSASIDDASGWVHLLSVRLATHGEQRPGASGVRSLLQVGRSDATVTTGVRGLTVEQLMQAHENRAELEKLVAMQPEPGQVRSFAEEGDLREQQVDPPAQDSKRGKRGRRNRR